MSLVVLFFGAARAGACWRVLACWHVLALAAYLNGCKARISKILNVSTHLRASGFYDRGADHRPLLEKELRNEWHTGIKWGMFQAKNSV